jgi:O-methyltransferase
MTEQDINQAASSVDMTAAELYLDLLRMCLTRSIFNEKYRGLAPGDLEAAGVPIDLMHGWLSGKNLEIVRTVEFDSQSRAEGTDMPSEGETMIGLRRLQNLQECIADVLKQKIEGDLLEAGVWRGGATIFMRGALQALGDRERTVWVADSFAGLPPPNPELYPADEGAIWHLYNNVLAISLDEVKANFARYGLLDERVRFLKGWFKDTLPTAPIERLAVLRLDGDMYESTIVTLRALYPKLSPGGYVIIDDYAPSIPGCLKAVDDFRSEYEITEEMISTGHFGVFWKRLR